MTEENTVKNVLRCDQSPSRAGCPVLIASVVLLHVFASLAHAQSSARTPHSGIANPYLFQGARYDPETGFYYFRNRYYDPRAGRFLQRDPVWDEQNVGGWYTFVGNGPATRRDPVGLDSPDQQELQQELQKRRQRLDRQREMVSYLESQALAIRKWSRTWSLSDYEEEVKWKLRWAKRDIQDLENQISKLERELACKKKAEPTPPSEEPPPKRLEDLTTEELKAYYRNMTGSTDEDLEGVDWEKVRENLQREKKGTGSAGPSPPEPGTATPEPGNGNGVDPSGHVIIGGENAPSGPPRQPEFKRWSGKPLWPKPRTGEGAP